MSIKNKLKYYGEANNIIPCEQEIAETVQKSMEVYCLTEQRRILTYGEFLWTQFCFIRKRWWLSQALLLLLILSVLPSIKTEQLTQRILGSAASFFIILIIPELWKNRTYQAMEIEAASYYTLSQIYAARMLLFGVVDIALITIFFMSATITMELLFSQFLIQFLFPLTVTAAICFNVLCSKLSFSEPVAMMMCMIWNTIWLVVILNERIYTAITIPLWIVFIGGAFVLLFLAVHRTICCCNDYWEERLNEIRVS